VADRRIVKRSFAAAAMLLLGGCGYFNAMYNARQQFAEAERAAARGESGVATRAYLDAIDRAAASYRNHPESRWADDALLLIARARWELGEHVAARAAAEELLLRSDDEDKRAAAHAYAGAAALRADDPAATLHLDSAVAHASGDFLSLALLARARLRFANASADAWTDLERAAAHDGFFASEARLEAATRAISATDTLRARAAFDGLFDDAHAARWRDSIAILIDATAATAGAAFAWSATSSADDAAWPGEERDVLRLRRVAMLAAAGDTAGAIEQALDLAGRTSALTAGQARTTAARLRLATSASIEEVLEVRNILLPAIDDAEARTLLRTIAAVEVLLERAAGGQPLALFAAGEIARDALRAPAFARSLFLAYADVVPDALWAPKAVLAAAAIQSAGDGQNLTARFEAQQDNVYVKAILDRADPAAFQSAEERLARSLAALRQGAFADADQRDLRVARAVATLDSLKLAAIADSMRLICGQMLDSLAVTGIRADSVRAACVRTDSALVQRFLAIDTLLLRDSTMIGIDTLQARRTIGRDTTAARDRE
jgi:hypothetical protein